MADMQTTHSNEISRKKSATFWFKIHLLLGRGPVDSKSPLVQLMVWPRKKQATSQYLHRWRASDLKRICITRHSVQSRNRCSKLPFIWRSQRSVTVCDEVDWCSFAAHAWQSNAERTLWHFPIGTDTSREKSYCASGTMKENINVLNHRCAPNGARTSAGTKTKNRVTCIYMGPTLEGLISVCIAL